MIALAAIIGIVAVPFMVALWVDAGVERWMDHDDPDRPFDWMRDGL